MNIKEIKIKDISRDYKMTINIDEFRKRIREYCFVDDKDNLIVEVIENKDEKWEYSQTFKIPVKSISTFHDIYDFTETSWNYSKLPTIYFKTIINELKEVELGGGVFSLHPNFKDCDNFQDLFSKDSMMSFSLSSKVIRKWLNKKFTIRCGYDCKGGWTKHTYYRYVQYLKGLQKLNKTETLSLSVPLNLSEEIRVPLGLCYPIV